ncbi:MAG: hypothetical protein MI757_12230 [Pirellulales bacterium]|nr:hypothetical protein [Pirellulales bacterium]
MSDCSDFVIDRVCFGDVSLIDSRVAAAPHADQGALRTTLAYLYLDDGPINLPRDRLKLAERYLDQAERIVVRWLYTRTNGSERKNYGSNALLAARAARYRCESCGFSDVRVLNLDHVHGRNPDNSEFACLCANCHAIKSRGKDWQMPD